ncbi:LON peptidase substrate-binding domain-containing protein [Aestuariibacter sp. A3R04]|uniref:LON peptidase substrate-binding domain-containing protein n=1 Tax=Aestuariibacter sp. A3R04 TaxID=2841571 RepID=UPI001C09C2A9|nr:LON peptidase substrate-binding domain-containing protein [Aestuariibacter sp. A3R04]MBU3021911.1 LON peptidase substrate-binding domain-containing protein [Aestuariibacter sp. A3R04]
MTTDKYPLFPLSAHLLPGGRMALRIFEPRYVRMVKEVCASGGHLVMCMLNAKGDKETNQHIYPIGTLATVIDFDLLDDGLLGIKVAGLVNVEVSNIETQQDGLRTACCENLSPWQCHVSPQQLSPIDDRLKEIFERYPELAELYDELHYDDPIWVMQRWLELLPVDAKQKQYFLEQGDCNKLLNYLAALVQ